MTTPPALHGISQRQTWATNIEVKWSANPDANLWIQDSDRHDRDIAVLVTGQQSNMKIKGWIPVAIAKKPRYRNNRRTTGACLKSIYNPLKRS
jgi:hypothetical protein